MSEPIWTLTLNPITNECDIVTRTWPDSLFESKSTNDPAYQAWLAEGNTPEPYVAPPPPPEPTPVEKLANAGLTVDELKTLLGLK